MQVKRLLTLLTLLLAAALLAGGCGKPRGAGPELPAGVDLLQGELKVYVPCGVAGPYGEIKQLFESRHPQVKVTQEISNIDVQAKLITAGKADGDVWISLGDREMAQVVKAGRVEGEPFTYAYNSIAFIVKTNNPCGIEALADLVKKEVRTIALPTEANSSGYYAKQAMEKAGVWDKVQDKLWLTDEPAQVKAQLTGGKAEVGVVYYPCSMETRIMGGKPEPMASKIQLLGRLPEDLTGRIQAQAAALKDSQNPPAARAFLQLMAEPQVQDIWEKWLFERAVKTAGGPQVTLYVYCGAGIRPFMDQALEAYKKLQPQVRIDVGYAGSGCLLSQLAFGKRGDLYMPGEDFYIDQATERGFLVSQQPVGYFEPVLLVQKDNPKGIKTLADLAKPGIKIGLGEPDTAAIGVASEALLKKAGLQAQVAKNVVLRAGNVPELGNSVKLKSVDVAIVWNVTAAQYPDDTETILIERKHYEPSLVPIGLLTFSQHTAEAKAFMDFLTGAAGQKLVRESGMSPADGG